MALRLLADENIYQEIVEQLRADGIDVRSVQEFGKAQAPDTEVIRLAQKEDRILLTFDRDFGDIRYLPQLAPGVVLLRFRQTPIEEITDRVEEVLTDLGERGLRGFLTVITPLHVRRRPLAPSPEETQ